MDHKRYTIDISWMALFKILAMLAGIWAIVFLKDIVVMMFLVFIFVGVINPFVKWMEKYMRRTLAVTVVYAILLLLISLFVYMFIPPLVTQLNELSKTLPDTMDKIKSFTQLRNSTRYEALIDQALKALTGSLSTISGNLYGFTLGVFGGLATFLTGLVLSFYLLLEEKSAQVFFYQVLPRDRYEAVYTTVMKISNTIGSWARGQFFLMGIIWIANFILFLIMGVPSPLPLSIFAGLCEIIPYIGPILGIAPAVIVEALTGNPVYALLILGISLFGIQQVQGHLIVPRVMSKVIGLSPVLVILSLLIGSKMYGLIGALVAIPTAAIIAVIVGEWPQLRKLWEKGPVSE